MRFQTPLEPARLIRRYKRFLADIALPDGREVTAHCPNPGSMAGLAEPGSRIWVEPNDDPRKKLDYGWRLTELEDGGLACIDTGRANRVVGDALRAGAIAPLAGYAGIRPEQPYGTGSRVDFRLDDPTRGTAWVEVKSVTLSRQTGLAEFPDSVTQRGARHLGDLAERARAGERAVLLYLVQRNDATACTLAADIDPAYARAHAAALEAGVEILAYRADLSPQAITLGPELALRSPAG